MRYQSILLFGAPGSGKGTQGKALGALPDFFHCSCGDVFRNVDVASSLGKTFKQLSAKGELMPDSLAVDVWLAHIQTRRADGSYNAQETCLVLDGIPRNIAQARLMRSYIDVALVLHLKCSRELLVQRLRRRAIKEGRLDDASDHVIHNRLSIYERESEPLITYYGDRLCEVSGDGPAYEVLHSILTSVLAGTTQGSGHQRAIVSGVDGQER